MPWRDTAGGRAKSTPNASRQQQPVRPTVRRGTKSYLAASLVAQASALARYVVLARMVGPTELGLAATLILTAQFFESISDTGADRFIVQDATGDTPATQGLVQV